jgi:hypothetical protein
MIFELAALGSWLYWGYRCWKRDGHSWSEAKSVTKWLFLGPGPTPQCRVCEVDLPDPMLRDELGHGAFVCLDCEEEVRLEAGLIRPDWFDQPLPPEGQEVPKQIEGEVETWRDEDNVQH